MNYPTRIDFECPSCGNIVINKHVTFFGAKTLEINCGGFPEIICLFCKEVIGILKPIETKCSELEEENGVFILFN